MAHDETLTDPAGERRMLTTIDGNEVCLSRGGTRPSVDLAVEIVGVVPFLPSGEIVAVVLDRGIELPSGHVEHDERPDAAIRREAWEEARIRLGELLPVTSFHLSSGSGQETDRQVAIYAAVVTELAPFERSSESTERLILTPDEFCARYRSPHAPPYRQVVTEAIGVMAQVLDQELTGPAVTSDPHAANARLRQAGPVHRIALPDGSKAWLVTRYADVHAAYADPRLKVGREFSSGWQGLAVTSALGVTLANTDPPVHTRLRKLVAAAFTRHRVRTLRPRIHEIADTLLDSVCADGGGDLVSAFAHPLPIAVFRELYGIPEADEDEVFEIAGRLFLPRRDDGGDARAEIAHLVGYITGLIKRRQREPGADLLSALINARDVDGRLSETELTALTAMLMAAGFETTTCLISSSALQLCQRPELVAALTGNPGLIPATVEEILRHDPPVPAATRRFASAELTIGDTRIPRGDTVILSIASACRDSAAFTAPDRLDHRRAEAGRHLAFGHGIHHCVGAPLARIEGEVALATLLRRLPGLTLAVPADELRWHDTPHLRGVRELPVTWRSPAPRSDGVHLPG